MTEPILNPTLTEQVERISYETLQNNMPGLLEAVEEMMTAGVPDDQIIDMCKHSGLQDFTILTVENAMSHIRRL